MHWMPWPMRWYNTFGVSCLRWPFHRGLSVFASKRTRDILALGIVRWRFQRCFVFTPTWPGEMIQLDIIGLFFPDGLKPPTRFACQLFSALRYVVNMKGDVCFPQTQTLRCTSNTKLVVWPHYRSLLKQQTCAKHTTIYPPRKLTKVTWKLTPFQKGVVFKASFFRGDLWVFGEVIQVVTRKWRTFVVKTSKWMSFVNLSETFHTSTLWTTWARLTQMKWARPNWMIGILVSIDGDKSVIPNRHPKFFCATIWWGCLGNEVGRRWVYNSTANLWYFTFELPC